MNQYLILQHPGHNRVYYTHSGALAKAELTIASSRLSAKLVDITDIEIAGIKYLSFSSESELSDKDIDTLSRLSFLFALYKLEGTLETPSLVPIQSHNYHYVDPKISTLQKYQGKTNELFTKMMINVGLLSSDFDYDTTIELLDPVAGKGTSLYEGVIYGMNVTGVEVDSKSTQAVQLFFKKYLEAERYKHTADTRILSGSKKTEAIYTTEFFYATSKQDFKNEATRKKLAIVNGYSQYTSKYFKKPTFHLIIGDLPYGVAHANAVDKQTKVLSRNPADMLSECLPEWYKVLKTGGALVLAWNTFVVSKHKLRTIAKEHGFTVCESEVYDQFEHMVDKSIKRDILVLQKNS